MAASQPGTAQRTSLLQALATRWRSVNRFASGVVGADKYERYLAWHRTTGQPGKPLDVKAFWRHEMDRQEANPGTRCC